jgi:thiamine-phosphate pyrophosphorylase
MLLYYITDRKQFAGSAAEQRDRLLAKIGEASAAGIDLIQLREKDLSARELEQLAREAMERVQNSQTRLLINSRADVALAVGAAGVHLRGDDISAADARAIWMRAASQRPFIAVSCHSAKDVAMADAQGADLAVLGPIFGKAKDENLNAIGIKALKMAASRPGAQGRPMPMLALGGVTLENAAQCLRAGAAGIAGIRIFQEGDLDKTVKALRALEISARDDGPGKHPYWPG